MSKLSALKTLFVLLLLVVFTSGCAVQQPGLSEDNETLYVQYDIQYDDNTKVGIDLIVLSSQLPNRAREIEADVFESVQAVAHELGQSQILQRQAQFRNALNSKLDRSSSFGSDTEIMLVSVTTGTWMAQN